MYMHDCQENHPQMSMPLKAVEGTVGRQRNDKLGTMEREFVRCDY